MKFMWISDVHLRGKNSIHRIGNYFEDVLTKLDEVINIYKKKNCSFLIIAGDLFDSHTVSNTVVDEFVDRIEKNNIKVKVIWGNHDLSNCNLNASKGTSLTHILRRSKNFELLDEYEDDTCYIKGINYEFNIEDKIRTDGLFVKDTDKFKIIVTHAFITEKDFHPNVNHIKAIDIKTNVNLIICSHFHESFEKYYKEVDGESVFFCNLGAFGRLSVSEAKKQPKVALADTETREIDVLELMSAKKGHEIFDLAKYNELKENKKDIKDFLERLNNVEWQSMDIKSQIAKIGKEEKIETDVIDYIFKKIGDINE